MRSLKFVSVIAFAAICLPVAPKAQDFPTRPITIIVPFPPGGATDQGTRLIAQKMSESIGQPIIIDNRPGAGGQVGAVAVKTAKPDGYTLYVASVGSHAINQSLYSKLNYDPIKDFTPVVEMFGFPHVLAVPLDSPVSTVSELVVHAKKQPNTVTFASQGIGAGGHLLAEMFKHATKIDVIHVPYKGTAQLMPDLLAGRIGFIFDGMPGAGPLIAEGKLKGLAVADDKRSALLPNVPTMKEVGFPGIELSAWFGIVAPAGTPKAVVDKLNAEFVKAIRNPEVSKKITNTGAFIVASSPSEFERFIALEAERLGKVVRESGARVD